MQGTVRRRRPWPGTVAGRRAPAGDSASHREPGGSKHSDSHTAPDALLSNPNPNDAAAPFPHRRLGSHAGSRQPIRPGGQPVRRDAALGTDPAGAGRLAVVEEALT